jgi:hypothetical protein
VEYVAAVFRPVAQAVEVGFYFFPGPTVLAVAGLLAALVAAVRNPGPLRGKWPWLLLPAVIPAAILGVGVAFPHGGDPETAPAGPVYAIWVLLLAHLPVAIVQVALFRRNPLVPLGVSALLAWLSLGAAIMSEMAVRNDWL